MTIEKFLTLPRRQMCNILNEQIESTEQTGFVSWRRDKKEAITSRKVSLFRVLDCVHKCVSVLVFVYRKCQIQCSINGNWLGSDSGTIIFSIST